MKLRISTREKTEKLFIILYYTSIGGLYHEDYGSSNV